jgi:hypothetical protein
MAFSKATETTLRKSLREIRGNLPYLYAQWLIEYQNGDYRVVAAEGADGNESFDVAHRTGVIGQIFRTESPIWIGDVKGHPLYDPFDERVTWEIALPAFTPSGKVAVLNLEGSGKLGEVKRTWRRIADVVQRETGFCVSQKPPAIGKIEWWETRYIGVTFGDSRKRSALLLDLVNALAARGEWVVIIGNVPTPKRSDYPTFAEATARGVAATACIRPLCARVDALATGNLKSQERAKCLRSCRKLVEGRYQWAVTLGTGKDVDDEGGS